MKQFPQHVIDLAQSIHDWKDCRFALKDALIEIGLKETAEKLFNNMIFWSGLGFDDDEPIHSRSMIVGVILQESLWINYINKNSNWLDYQELFNYLNN